jgi:phosphotriesterase-related protein
VTDNSTIMSVLGPVAVSEMGVTLMHEHVCMTNEGQLLDSRIVDDRGDRLAAAVAKLRAARDVGVTTIVDATPIDLNRDAAFIREASEASDLNIVCSTGLYTESHGQPAYFKHMPAQELSDLFVHELTEGIANTGVRAGVLKCATSEGEITAVEAKTMEAVADAQARTGVPVITHTSGGLGVEQARILTENGAAPARVMIGHVDHKRSSFSYYERILRTGVNMAFDRCGLQVFLPDTVRAALIAGLIAAGLQDRLFLSMDSVSSRIGPPHPFEIGAPEPLVYLMTDFTDLLGTYGVGPDTVRSLLTANPARLFS